jgi:ubiquinone biosynthesis protein
MEEQVGARAMLRSLKDDLPYLLEKLPEMPGLVYKSMKMYADGEYQLKQLSELKKIRQQVDQNHQRGAFVTSGSAAIVGASVVYALADSVPMVLGAPVLAWLAGITGVLLVVYGLRK